MSSSGRRKTRSRSRGVTTPASVPSPVTTGRHGTWCLSISQAASPSVVPGGTGTTRVVMTSLAMLAAAVASRPRRQRSGCPVPRSRCSSVFFSRSASRTMPVTVPLRARTGSAPICRSTNRRASSLNDVCGVTVMMSVVITSATVWCLIGRSLPNVVSGRRLGGAPAGGAGRVGRGSGRGGARGWGSGGDVLGVGGDGFGGGVGVVAADQGDGGAGQGQGGEPVGGQGGDVHDLGGLPPAVGVQQHAAQ